MNVNSQHLRHNLLMDTLSGCSRPVKLAHLSIGLGISLLLFAGEAGHSESVHQAPLDIYCKIEQEEVVIN